MSIFGLAVLLSFVIPVMQWRRMYDICGGGAVYRVLCGSLFPTAETTFQIERRTECGWVQAEDLSVIAIFFETIVENPVENP